MSSSRHGRQDGAGMKVVVGMSGGVDSAVTALLPLGDQLAAFQAK